MTCIRHDPLGELSVSILAGGKDFQGNAMAQSFPVEIQTRAFKLT